MPPSHPEKIGKYTIIKTLGRGAMGMVYEGHDPIIDRTVAIKVINKTSFDDHEQQEAMDRFKREAQAAGKLSHANIVMVYEYGEEDNTAFISMEYVAGRTLQDIMEKDSLTMGQVQDFMGQLLEGLDYAHTRRVTHRDIKPANLVYTDEGQIKIMDFGIARIESSSLTQVGTIMGTPAYMAPELFTGEPVDHRTDLFSAAVILYQLLTGQKPFSGETMSIIMHQVVNVHPSQPSEINRQLPKSLDTILQKALAKNSSNRFQSAAEFKKKLMQAFKKISSHAKTPRQTLGKSTDQTINRKKNQSQTVAPPQLKPLYLIGAGIVILLIIGALFLFSGGETIPDQEAATESDPPVITQETKKVSTQKKEPVKILRPESKKISRTKQPQVVKKQQQSTGISINGRRDNTETRSSGSGIRITTPGRD